MARRGIEPLGIFWQFALASAGIVDKPFRALDMRTIIRTCHWRPWKLFPKFWPAFQRKLQLGT